MQTEFGQVLTPHTGRIKWLSHRKQWITNARPNQLPPPGKAWDIWLVLAGRGFGKTRLGVEQVAHDTWNDAGTITHVAAATHGDLRSVCYEGHSGLLSVIPPECIKPNGYNKSLGELTLTNGSIFRGFSAEAPDRARGPQCHRIWGDEVAAWDLTKGSAQEMFDQIMFGLRLGDHAYAVLTTTPKPIQLIKNLVGLAQGRITEYNQALKDLRVVVTRGSTKENFENLSRNFQIIVSQYEGTRLGRQELDAEILEDTQDALWTSAIIDKNRCAAKSVPELVRIVVSIDPAASTSEHSDETGMIVAGIDQDGDAYVLEDASSKMSPNEWGMKAIELFRKYTADCIIGEINNGGDMVENTIRGIDQYVPFTGVRATRGKAMRAEPVATLYEQGRVHHAGTFAKLEDQLCMLSIDFNRRKAGFSPDRADALVWAMTELVLGEQDGMGIYEYYRQQAQNTQTRKIEGGTGDTMVTLSPGTCQSSTIYTQDGRKFDVVDGVISVPQSAVAGLIRQGFVAVEHAPA